MNIIRKILKKKEIFTQYLLKYGDKYKDKVEIIKGKLYYATKNKQEIKWLQDMGIEPNPYDIVDGELLSSDGNLLLVDEQTGSLTIPPSVTKIGEGAFANVDGLKTIIIPGTCKEIGKNAFNGNKTLENVIMQDGVEKIGEAAFKNCINLKNVKMTDSVTTLGTEAFMENRNLENITLSNSITEIPTYAFYNNVKLKEIKLPNNLKKINGNAFTNCESIETINLPENVESIEGSAFGNCKNLKNFNIAEKNKNFIYENGILLNSEKTKMVCVLSTAIKGNTFVVPNNIKSLESNVISNYSQITRVEIPKSVSSISVDFFGTNVNQIVIDSENESYLSTENAIYDKSKTALVLYLAKDKNVVLEEGLLSIRYNAFKLNTGVENITLPNSLQNIYGQAFWNCNRLTSLKLGPNVQHIDPLAFYRLDNLKLEIDKGNNYYVMENNVLFNKDKKTLITIIGNPENFAIPEGVEKIESAAFHNKSKLKSIVIPNTVKEIGNSFNYCTALTSIEIPASVTKIGRNCFNNTNNLKSIIIHNEKGVISGSPWGCRYGERAISYQP